MLASQNWCDFLLPWISDWEALVSNFTNSSTCQGRTFFGCIFWMLGWRFFPDIDWRCNAFFPAKLITLSSGIGIDADKQFSKITMGIIFVYMICVFYPFSCICMFKRSWYRDFFCIEEFKKPWPYSECNFLSYFLGVPLRFWWVNFITCGFGRTILNIRIPPTRISYHTCLKHVYTVYFFLVKTKNWRRKQFLPLRRFWNLYPWQMNPLWLWTSEFSVLRKQHFNKPFGNFWLEPNPKQVPKNTPAADLWPKYVPSAI